MPSQRRTFTLVPSSQCAADDTLVVLLPPFVQACNASECFYRVEILNNAVLDDTKLVSQVLEGNRVSSWAGAFACPPSANSSECLVREEGGEDDLQIESDAKDGRVQYLLKYAEKCVGFKDYPNDAICANQSAYPVFA